MGIALVIVGGLIVITLVSVLGGNAAMKIKGSGGPDGARLDKLERRLETLEGELEERNARIGKLETELGFMSKLIEDKGRS